MKKRQEMAKEDRWNVEALYAIQKNGNLRSINVSLFNPPLPIGLISKLSKGNWIKERSSCEKP